MDEATGKIGIAESRKELYSGRGYQRICYTSNVVFSDSPDTPLIRPITTMPSSHAYALPDEPILRLLRSDDHPYYFPPPLRFPEDVHPDNPDLLPRISDVPLQYYSTSATTFVDLFNSTTEGKQGLWLRVQSRQPRTPLYYPNYPKAGLLYPLLSDLLIAIKEMYQERICEWPPIHDQSKLSRDLDAIYKRLNPPNYLGVVNGTADERSIVYMTGSGENDNPRAAVIMSFDPAIKLLGLKGWRRESTATFKGFNKNTSKCSAWLGKKDRYCKRSIITANQKRKASLLQSITRNRIHDRDEAEELAGLYFCNGWHRSRGRYAISSLDRRKLLWTLLPGAADASEACWMWKAQPMYMDICLGVYLGT